MEKNTYSSSMHSEKRKQPNVAVWKIIVLVLLVSVVCSISMPYSMSVEAASLAGQRIASFSAGASPSAAKIGDLDGDGLNDIAVVNLQGSLQLFFNNGGGSFARTSLNGLWPSSSYTLDVDIGDLNGDGRNDIAVAFSTQSGAVSVLLNKGSRTFAAPVNFNLCSSSSGVAIGDLDRDGDNDLADVNQCFKSGVLLNNGQGGFSLKGVYGEGYGSKSVALADFNGDGLKDITYLNNGLGNVTVLLNQGNATFGTRDWYYVGDLPDDLTVGDFEGDGDLDIAVANSYFSQVFILINGGDGDFISYSELYGGNAPTGITSADFNRDGRLDFAVISGGANTLSIFINQGYYTYGNPATFAVGQFPVDIAAGDLDSDGLPDLVAVNQGSGTITALFSTGSASAPPPADQITLTVSKRTTKREKLIDLKWSGATGSSIDVYRSGSRIATVPNNGSYTDRFSSRATGTVRYKVCVAGSQTCSNEATISF